MPACCVVFLSKCTYRHLIQIQILKRDDFILFCFRGLMPRYLSLQPQLKYVIISCEHAGMLLDMIPDK